MATLQVVSVFDGALQAFGRPLFVPHVGVAMRSFMDEMAKSDSEMAKHPGDYELHHIASFVEETARFYPLGEDVGTVCLLRGADCVKPA